MPTATRAELVLLLAKLSYRKGTFRLASGRESDFYVDVKQTVMRADGARALWASAPAWALPRRAATALAQRDNYGRTPLAAALRPPGPFSTATTAGQDACAAILLAHGAT